MPDNLITLPGGYATAFAVGFADSASGKLSLVDGARPLPVQTVAPAAADSLSGTLASGGVAGPFIPAAGRPVYITLSGTWQGTVSVQRSTDGGVTRQPLTLGGAAWGTFTSNACEPFWEEHEAGATLYLAANLASGPVSYRLAQ